MDLEQSCEDDNDCKPNFYCYKISQRCVNFTLCSRYNRAEGSAPARSATQCGPCMTGYATETLADGKENPICQQNVINEKHYTGFMTEQSNKIWIAIFPLILFLLVILLYFRIRKYRIFRKWYNTINCFASNDTANFNEINTHVPITNATNNNALTIATAPEEQSPFIECITDKCHIYDNNEPTIDNEYQTATPCEPPRWVNVTQFDNSNTDVPNERNIVAQNNISDNNQPAHEIQLSIAEAPEVNTEQQDNARNTLLQIYSSDNDENPSHETNKNNNNNKMKNIIINQSVNQSITMNLNVFKEDEC